MAKACSTVGFPATLALLVLAVTGCNSDRLPTYPVSGRIRFEDGSFPRFGMVEFYSDSLKLNARGRINRDGSFTVGTYGENDGAVAGQHQVVIIQQTSGYLTADLEGQIQHDHGDLISPQYFDYRTSGLKCTIENRDNEIEFVIRKGTDSGDSIQQKSD